MQVNGTTALYGIIGNPVAHSLSPAMQNAAFAALGENRIYLPLPTKRLAAAIDALRYLGFCGASVTIPYKEQIINELDEIDRIAERIGAVNTVVVRELGTRRYLVGMNTDWLGANRALAEAIALPGRHAVILGAGGAARAIGFGLLEAGATIEINSRTEASGRALATALGCPWRPLSTPDASDGDILVNATSVGMAPDDSATPIGREALRRFQVVMDIVYAPLQTRLLREAAEFGCRCVDGLQMLLYQGVAQFELWTGRQAPVDVMRQALLAGVVDKDTRKRATG